MTGTRSCAMVNDIRSLILKYQDRHFGDTFWRAIMLVLGDRKFRSRAAMAKELGVTRARIKALLDTAVVEGILEHPPFEPQPQKAREWSRRRTRDLGPK